MNWQDWVMGIGQCLFFVALIPTIKAVEKPEFETGLLTSIILTIYIPTFWTMHLYWSVLSTLFVATGWWIITCQSWKRRKVR